MAYRHVYVDPDATDTPENGTTWGKAYASLNAAEQAEDNTGDIATSNEIVVFHCRASSGTEDTAAVSISGWTTSAEDYIVIVAEAINTSYGDGASETTGTGRHSGVWTTDRYRLNLASTGTLTINEEYVRVEGLQIRDAGNVASGRYAVGIAGIGTSDIRLGTCLIRSAGNASYNEYTVFVNDADATVTIWNCAIYGASTASVSLAIYVQTCTAVNVYGCTIQSGKYGILRSAGTVTAKNCYASGASTYAYSGTITLTTCASSDHTGTSSPDLHAIAYDTTEGAGHAGFTNVTAGSENFTLKAGSALVGVGTTLTDDPPGSTALGVDIAGNARS